MMYRSNRKPGTSIVHHPIFPGMLNLELTDVLPWGYQSVPHCTKVNFAVSTLDFQAPKVECLHVPVERIAIANSEVPSSPLMEGSDPE